MMHRRWLSVAAAGVVCGALGGCGAPPKVQQARALQAEGQYVKAVDLYREALAEMSEGGQKTATLRQLNEALAKTADQALADANAAMGDATSLQQCDRAIAVLDSKATYDDPTGRLAARKAELQQQREQLVVKRGELLSQADQQADDAKWLAAIQQINQAMQIGGGTDLEAKRRTMIQRRDSDYAQRIRSACRGGDAREAQALLKAFAAEQPAPDAAALTPLRSAVGDARRTAVRADVAKKRYYAAYLVLTEAGDDGDKDLLGTIRRDGGQHYLGIGRQALKDSDLFSAYVAAVKAKALDGDEDAIFKFHRDCEDKVDASLQVQIGVATFGSPAKEPDAGEEFSDSLISYLSHTRPYGINIVERARIDEALKDNKQQFGQAAKLLGTQLLVVGNVSTLSVDKQQSQRNVTQRVKVGTQRVANPAYEAFVKRYGADPRRWPSPAPAETIEQPKYQMVTYSKGEARMLGAMTVSVRLFTTAKGAITQADTFTAEDSAQDTFQGGVPEAGIEDDPLVLPTELKVKQSLRTKMVKEVADWMLKSFECRQGRYYSLAEYHLGRRERSQAIEALAQGYLYCLRDRVADDDEWFKKIRQLMLIDLTEPTR